DRRDGDPRANTALRMLKEEADALRDARGFVDRSVLHPGLGSETELDEPRCAELEKAPERLWNLARIDSTERVRAELHLQHREPDHDELQRPEQREDHRERDADLDRCADHSAQIPWHSRSHGLRWSNCMFCVGGPDS